MKRTFRQLPGGGFVEVTSLSARRIHALHTREGLREQREASARGVGSVHEIKDIEKDAQAHRDRLNADHAARRKEDVADVVRWASVSGVTHPADRGNDYGTEDSL